MTSSSNTTFLLCAFFFIWFASSRAAYQSNVLLTGQTISQGDRSLAYEETGVWAMLQYDCRLVIYNQRLGATWSSNSTCRRTCNCSLSFTDNGRLFIQEETLEKIRPRPLWITPNENSKVGKYVAILRPEGQIAIYGPGVWSVGSGETSINHNSSKNINNDMVSSTKNLKNSPFVYNALFSGEVLYNNGKLFDNGYSFIMKDVCELVLENKNEEIPWRSWTNRYGDHCFARLNHKGELTIVDDDYKIIWSNKLGNEAPEGEYVLLMQKNGNVVIYGPRVWSTADLNSHIIEVSAVDE